MKYEENDCKIVRYKTHLYSDWNHFVTQSKNGTFLFHRDFMEYHSNRFEDFSLLIYKREKLIAIFPAHIKNSTVYSHQGLTYGGLLFPCHIKFNEVSLIVKTLLNFLKVEGFQALFIKEIPKIYHKQPANEVSFWLNKLGCNSGLLKQKQELS